MAKTSITKAVAMAKDDGALLKKKSTEGLSKVQKLKLKNEKMKEASKLAASYCRKCNNMLPYGDFYQTTNSYVDTNGKMSVCKDCLDKMYEEFFATYNDFKRTIFLICQHLDIKYDEEAVSASIIKLDKLDEGDKKFTPFGYYIKQLNYKNRNTPIRFNNSEIERDFKDKGLDLSEQHKKELLIKWGDRPQEDYDFLESKYNEYVNEFGANSVSEKDNYIQLCSLILRCRQDPTNKDANTALKEQYKSMGISPDQMRKENKEKGIMTLGMTIAQMEMTDPADYYNRPEMYFDHDGLEKDKQELLRSQKNHLTGSKDFESTGFDSSEILDYTEDEDV